METGNWIQLSILIVLAVTMVGVFLYVRETNEQARATRRIAEASLRPALQQWIDETPVTAEKLVVEYKNYGNGPAVNIRWTLEPTDQHDHRNGMGTYDEKGKVEFALGGSATRRRVVAEYVDLYGNEWVSTLALTEESGVLKNGETTHEGRTA